VNVSGNVEEKNPLRYAQSLRDQSYSWVDVRPKDMVLIGLLDWKAEIASHEVGDPAVEYSGIRLKAVDVDYRKDSGDANTSVYFFRTREEAESVAAAAKAQEEASAWRQKFMSLPYMIANRDAGFKLAYAVCKDTGKNAAGEDTCKEDGWQDWSDNIAVAYHWFRDLNTCGGARFKLYKNQPADVKVDKNSTFMADCVPAPNVSGRVTLGYKVIFTLPAAAAGNNDAYMDLRVSGARTATIFKTFDACYNARNAAFTKSAKDLGLDEENVDFMADCVRVY
jgi:hypothetical protein